MHRHPAVATELGRERAPFRFAGEHLQCRLGGGGEKQQNSSTRCFAGVPLMGMRAVRARPADVLHGVPLVVGLGLRLVAVRLRAAGARTRSARSPASGSCAAAWPRLSSVLPGDGAAAVVA